MTASGPDSWTVLIIFLILSVCVPVIKAKPLRGLPFL